MLKLMRELKQGEFFTRRDVTEPKESQVWVRGSYDRANKSYECYKFDDINTISFVSGKKPVFTGFTF